MGNDMWIAAKGTAAAFELLLVLFMLPSSLSLRPEKDDPDYMLRMLLFLSLGRSVCDLAFGMLPQTIQAGTCAAYALLSGALALAAVTAWYLFTVAYLWNSLRSTANGMRLSLIWILIWAVVAAAGLAKGELQSELNNTAGSYALLQALAWITLAPVALSEVLLACKHENLQSKDIALLALFPLPVCITVALSYLEPTLLWNSPGMSLMLLAVSLYLQSSKSQKDPLTGAHTRTWFKAKLAERLKDARSSPFMLLMLDLDNFKKINDTWGHQEGDIALIIVVELLKKSLRNSDFIARFAGDEFLVLANIAGQSECAIIMRRIREQLMEYNLNSGKPYTLGWSTGMIYCDKPMNPDELLVSVDSHMYRAKKEGKR